MRYGLLASGSRICYAPVDEGTGGGAAGGGGSTPVAPAEPGAAGAADAGTLTPPAADLTALAAAKAPEPEETAEAKTTREAAEAAAALAAETPEQKAAREAKEREGETPEQKATREAAEKVAADTAKAEALKPYDVLTLPEGMPKEQPAYQNFVAAAADNGVTPEVAQKLLDTVAPEIQRAVNAPFETWATTVEGWAQTCAADPEFGGANYDKNMGVAALAIDKVGGKQAQGFRDMLAFTGIGNNPEFIRFVYRVGKMVSEGSPVLGAGAVEQKADLGDRMYPGMTAKT